MTVNTSVHNLTRYEVCVNKQKLKVNNLIYLPFIFLKSKVNNKLLTNAFPPAKCKTVRARQSYFDNNKLTTCSDVTGRKVTYSVVEIQSGTCS